MDDLMSLAVSALKGVGEKRAEVFHKHGIYTVYDLLTYYPSGYEDRRRFVSVSELTEGEKVCVKCKLWGGVRTFRKGRKFSVTNATFADDTGDFACVWYNQPYVEQSLKRDKEYVLYGKAEKSGRGLRMVNPAIEPDDGATVGKIVPVYTLGRGLGMKTLQKTLLSALEMYEAYIPEPIPREVREKYGLMSAPRAVHNMHFPEDYETLKKARERIVFEEFFLFQMRIAKIKNLGKRDGFVFSHLDSAFEKRLPFALTSAQKKVVETLKSDFASGKAMNRLVQGDVGSGKTVVAAYGMDLALKNGYQAAMMAPTEILAAQHLKSLKKLFPNANCALLTSSVPKRQKQAIKDGLADGSIQIAIGTHALIQGDVHFKNLGFVVTDEQHRFGVAQRAELGKKGKTPHMLVMTATPIPRTLALILYGDLDISTIDSLPPGRQKIDTFCVDESFRTRVYTFLRKRLEAGEQAYIICPLVEESEAVSAKDTVSFADSLQTDFPDFTIGLLHGKMKDKEKEEVMGQFARGRISALVSTTVVEVGVDVPNATTMIIENAERFGLSQLHQLRGRVGRGSKKSYCILFAETKNPETLQRLKVIEQSTDGFYISEQDLKLRGPGDFFGTRQHGVPALKTANPAEDTSLLYASKEAVEALINGTLSAAREEKAILSRAMKYAFAEKEIAEILN